MLISQCRSKWILGGKLSTDFTQFSWNSAKFTFDKKIYQRKNFLLPIIYQLIY